MTTTTSLHSDGASMPAASSPEDAQPIEHAPATSSLVTWDVLRRSTGVGLLIVGVLAVGALIVAAAVLGSGLFAVGAFLAFSLMLLIGMPLILACIEEALDAHSH